MVVLCEEELQSKLRNYCNWASLPPDLLASTGSRTTAAAGNDEAALTAFLQHLAALVPFEWSVMQQSVFEAGAASSSSSRHLHAMMHAPGVGTQDGVMCFGGVQLGVVQEVKVDNEVSWIKNAEPIGLAPDYSRVYQGTPTSSSRQVVRLCPSSSKPGAPWAAHPVSPALDTGLLGHSAAVWGNRAFIFGGLQEFSGSSSSGGADSTTAPGTVSKRTVNLLRAYALDEAGTQGGLLPVLSELPQLGQVPSCRMYHSATVNPEGGVMYVYGGVTLHTKTNTRVPADSEPGLVHAFDFGTYTWTTLQTTGDCRPCSTTLLAFFWHAGALHAIPDLPRVDQQGGSSGSRRAGRLAAAGYQLLRLDMDSRQWQMVTCQGEAPSQRMDSCSVYNPVNQELVVYGGRLVKPPFSLLADVHILRLPEPQVQQQQQQQQQPVWQQVQPVRLSSQQQGSSSSQQQQPHLQGMLPLAGHAGGVVGGSGEVVFVGGYRRNDVKEPQPLLQVLTKAVKPPTPDAAKLAAVVSQQALAMQHVRMQLARLVKRAHPAQVLLKPDGAGVRLPARLLALYSALFDDLFQELLDEQQEEQQQPAAAAAAAAAGQPPQPVHVVPVPGVQQDSIAAVCRWMMGLLALRSCKVETLVDMYRVGDRLVMEQLMVEVLEELTARELLPQEAAAVMQLAGDFPGAGDMVHKSAAQQLQQQVSPATAPAIMALARQQDNKALQDRCVEVMLAHRKNDVFGVLDFALRFNLRSLQGSCLGSIRRQSRDRLVDRAERIMQVVSRRLLYGQDASRVATVQMLERDLCNEVEGAELQSLPSYVAVCERLCLRKLWEGIVDYCSRDEVWQSLQHQPHKAVLTHLQQRHVQLYTAVLQQRGRGGNRAGAPVAVEDVADAALSLLGPARPAAARV